MSNLKFKEVEERIENLIISFHSLKKELINNDEINSIIGEFLSKLADLQKKIKLEIAFIGQYSAGKSTIISALTGKRDIEIGQDITTDAPKAYQWGKVLLVDTPGIYAGRPDHDKVTLEYIDKADLLVYVITTQGFTAETAANFKKLAFEENRIDRMMLVINKSSQGNRELYLENWISDALKVIEPKTERDLFLSVIDAKDYIEALDIENKDDRQELIKYSNFESFIENLNAFISEKKIIGQLITPLNLIQSYLNKIINCITAGNEDAKNLLEILNRKRFRIVESKENLSNIVKGHVDTIVSEIKKEGNRIANIIEKDIDKNILETEKENSVDRIKDLIDETNKKIKHSIENELTQLKNELNMLMRSELGQMLMEQDAINVNFNTDIKIGGIKKEKMKSGADIVSNIGKFAEDFAINKEAVKAGATGLRAVAGSDAHTTIYNIGKFFGYKFKPYEAVKYAEKISNIGKILVKAGVVLPVLIASYEEYSENKYEEEIKKKRQEIRRAYDDLANNVRESFLLQFGNFMKNTYDSEIINIDKIIENTRDSNKLNEKSVMKLQNLLSESKNILKELASY